MKLIKGATLLSIILVSSHLQAQSKIDLLFKPDSIRKIVEVLASDSMKGRFTGTAESYRAAQFIIDKFSRAGLKPLAGYPDYLMRIKDAWYNVVGTIQGKSKPHEVIIFSAHYDHVGTDATNPYPMAGGLAIPRKGDTIFNGANDNASGVSAIITLAKYFSLKRDNERTICFVAFTGEELGELGSKYFVERCNPDSIVAVINFDMIGRKYNNYGHPYLTGVDSSNLIDILNKRLSEFNRNEYGRNFIDLDPFPREHLFERSDNYPFAQKGIPAHSIMATSPKDIYYHNLGDEAKTLDYALISKIIKAIGIGAEGLVNGTDTPTRIGRIK